MVNKEQITPNIEEVKRAIMSAEMVRQASGSWTLIIGIGGLITLDEDRKAGFFGEARIKGAQSGRRPNPSRKGQFTKKAKKGGNR
jgi:hypothetical protein